MFYRHKTQIDNYERFPIKKIEGNEEIFEYIVKEVKEIHKLKSDYYKFKKGNVEFESDYFIKNILPKLEVYPIEEPNKYFDLKVPKSLGSNFIVDSPHIYPDDGRVLVLNNDGLKIVCYNEEIAKMIFEKYFKDIYGDLHELDISINISQLDREKMHKI